jgi:hypothetical protein
VPVKGWRNKCGRVSGQGSKMNAQLVIADFARYFSFQRLRCFLLHGPRLRFWRGLLVGLYLVLRGEFLPDGCGDGIDIHLVHMGGIPENLRGVNSWIIPCAPGVILCANAEE